MRAEAREEYYKSFFYHQSQPDEQAYNTEHGGDTSEQGKYIVILVGMDVSPVCLSDCYPWSSGRGD